MKFKSITILLLTLLLVPTFTACNARMDHRLDAAEEIVEDRLDAAEEIIENRKDAAENIAENPDNNSSNVTSGNTGTAENNAEANTGNPPSASPDTTITTITREEAESIALSHAGFTADEVSHLYTEYDFDDGIYKYEIQFYKDYWEYDYDIHAETGTILSFDKDRE